MAAIDTAYHYYLSTYAKQSTSRYDSHKKSELRNIYNNIVKINKDSPLYKIKRSADVQKFAIDIKESARIIQNVVASLSDAEEGIGNAFQKKLAFSSQEDVVSAKYMGDNKDSGSSDNFFVEVKDLATSQVNVGNYMDKRRLNLKPGSYSFDLENNASAYEFQFTVNPNDTNESIQKKLARLITNADIGLKATTVDNAEGLSALQIESVSTGLGTNEYFLFSVSPQGNHDSMAAIDALGIDHVAREAHNAVFMLNGHEHTAYTNNFMLDNDFELTLHGISPNGDPAVIGFKTNADAMKENIQTLVDSYNSILQTAGKYSVSQHQSVQLFRDMSNTAFAFQRELEDIGLIVEDNGQITIDTDMLSGVVNDENYEERLTVLTDFKNSLNVKANNASLDPMRYVDKILVTYKNPGKTYATPYITSIYSGMMMDEYC